MKGRPVAVVGSGYSELVRRSERPVGLLAVDAVSAALADAGLDPGAVDGLATTANTPVRGTGSVDGVDRVTTHLVARLTCASVRWHAQPADLIGSAFIEAVNAVAAGACDTCVVFRGMRNPPGAYNRYEDHWAAGDEQFTAPYGVHRGYQYFGGAYRRYLHEAGASRRDLAPLIVATREHAHRNPRAYFRDTPLTVDDYLNAPMLADPVCLLDCDIPVDGAAAIVLTTAEGAARLPGKPAYIAGWAQHIGSSLVDEGRSGVRGPRLEDVREAATRVGDSLWRSSGIGPSEVRVAELYDGYSFFVCWWLEALGFCRPLEALDFIARNGRELAINTFGGQLGEGRLHGIGHLVSAARQAAGRAGLAQIADAEVTIACCGPPTFGGAAVAFSQERRDP